MKSVSAITAASLVVAGAAALVFGGSAAWAQASKDPAQVKPGAYQADVRHTKIMFGVSHFGFSTYYGRFNDFAIKVNLDPAKPAASVVEVSLQTASLDTGDEKLNTHMKTADFLDVEKHPTVTFKSTKVETTGPTTAKVTGDFTMLGVTKPLVLDVTFNGAGVGPASKKQTAGFDARGVIKRTDWGMTKYAPAIGDDVQLIVSTELQLPE